MNFSNLFLSFSLLVFIGCTNTFGDTNNECEWIEDLSSDENKVFQVKSLVIKEEDCKEYPLGPGGKGGKIKHITPGAEQYEVWHSSIAVGASTPKHVHETEEVFVILKGEGKAIIGGEEVYFKAPCTLILPGGVEHQVFNLGDEPTDHYAILGKDSLIMDEQGSEMKLNWRE